MSAPLRARAARYRYIPSLSDRVAHVSRTYRPRDTIYLRYRFSRYAIGLLRTGMCIYLYSICMGCVIGTNNKLEDYRPSCRAAAPRRAVARDVTTPAKAKYRVVTFKWECRFYHVGHDATWRNKLLQRFVNNATRLLSIYTSRLKCTIKYEVNAKLRVLLRTSNHIRQKKWNAVDYI